MTNWPIRSWRERAIQVVSCELGALILVLPLYAWVTGSTPTESLLVLTAVSITAVAVTALFNHYFDSLEWSLIRRVASNRSSRWRLLHSVLSELVTTIGTCPVLVYLAGHSWQSALALDLGLSGFYVLYGIAFHRLFDRLRPVAVSCAVLFLVGLTAPSAVAQSSPSYKLSEGVLNQAGRPSGGSAPGSAAFRLTIDSVGAAVAPTAMTSSGFRMETGFPGTYSPAGEVRDLHITAPSVLTWKRDTRSGVAYNVYRELTAVLPSSYGSCLVANLSAPTTSDAHTPPAASAFFYLVTAENRLGEEGTRGSSSTGTRRAPTTPCP